MTIQPSTQPWLTRLGKNGQPDVAEKVLHANLLTPREATAMLGIAGSGGREAFSERKEGKVIRDLTAIPAAEVRRALGDRYDSVMPSLEQAGLFLPEGSIPETHGALYRGAFTSDRGVEMLVFDRTAMREIAEQLEKAPAGLNGSAQSAALTMPEDQDAAKTIRFGLHYLAQAVAQAPRRAEEIGIALRRGASGYREALSLSADTQTERAMRAALQWAGLADHTLVDTIRGDWTQPNQTVAYFKTAGDLQNLSAILESHQREYAPVAALISRGGKEAALAG